MYICVVLAEALVRPCAWAPMASIGAPPFIARSPA